MRDGANYTITRCKAGTWVEGVLKNDATIITPGPGSEKTRQEVCDDVLAELKRRAKVERNRLTRRRGRR